MKTSTFWSLTLLILASCDKRNYTSTIDPVTGIPALVEVSTGRVSLRNSRVGTFFTKEEWAKRLTEHNTLLEVQALKAKEAEEQERIWQALEPERRKQREERERQEKDAYDRGKRERVEILYGWSTDELLSSTERWPTYHPDKEIISIQIQKTFGYKPKAIILYKKRQATK